MLCREQVLKTLHGCKEASSRAVRLGGEEGQEVGLASPPTFALSSFFGRASVYTTMGVRGMYTQLCCNALLSTHQYLHLG